MFFNFFNMTVGSMIYRGQFWEGEGLLQDCKRVGVFKIALQFQIEN